MEISLILIMGGGMTDYKQGEKMKFIAAMIFSPSAFPIIILSFSLICNFFLLTFSCFLSVFLVFSSFFLFSPFLNFFPVFLSFTSYVRMTNKNYGPTMIFIFLPCLFDLPQNFPYFFNKNQNIGKNLHENASRRLI